MGAKSVLIFCAILGYATAKIPDYIHVCKRSDPHVSKCIRQSIELIRPQLKEGIPEIGVPPLEPLYIDEITIANGNSPSHFKAFLRNVKVYGASDFQINKLRVDLKNHTYKVSVTIPQLTFVGDYDIDAQILVLPIKGTGPFTANATNCMGFGTLKTVIERGDDGIRRFKFTSFNILLSIGDYNIHLDHLFNGDPVLGRATNEVLNENKNEFITQSLPFVQRKVSEILLEIADKITKNLDYDEAFPGN